MLASEKFERFEATFSGAGDTRDAGTMSWDVPLDGSAQVLQVSAVRSRDDGRWWRLGANAALVALIVWIVVAVAFLTYVSVARRRALRRIARRATP